MRLFNIILGLFLLSSFAYGQMGGVGPYAFLQLPSSAHTSALGGNNISLRTNEPSFIIQNPALLSDSISNLLFLHSTKLFADVFYGTTGYCFKNKLLGNTFVSLNFINYGAFRRFDELGNEQGSFYAADYALMIGFSKPFTADSMFTYGFIAKPVYSVYDHYFSFGFVFDAGLSYYNHEHLWYAGLVLKNLGYTIKPYIQQENEPIDWDVQLGISKKLKHAPLRISLTFQHLENWNLSNYEYDRDNPLGEYADTSKKYNNFERWSDEFLRHLIVGIDVVFSKNFYFAVGYNFQRRKELGTDTRMATTGLSWGFGLKLYRFQIHYARSAFHLAGATNSLSISSRIQEWYKK